MQQASDLALTRARCPLLRAAQNELMAVRGFDFLPNSCPDGQFPMNYDVTGYEIYTSNATSYVAVGTTAFADVLAANPSFTLQGTGTSDGGATRAGVTFGVLARCMPRPLSLRTTPSRFSLHAPAPHFCRDRVATA